MDELAPLRIVRVRQQGLHRHLVELRIAVELFAIGEGEFRRLHHEVDEFRAGDVEAVEARSP